MKLPLADKNFNLKPNSVMGSGPPELVNNGNGFHLFYSLGHGYQYFLAHVAFQGLILRVTSEARWSFDEHWGASGLLFLHIVGSSPIWEAYLLPAFPGHERLSAYFCVLLGLFRQRQLDSLYGLLLRKPHQI